MYENRFDIRRNTNENSTNEEFEMAVNGPNLAHCDSVVKEAMDNYWASRGGKWHFFKTSVLETSTQVVKRLMCTKKTTIFLLGAVQKSADAGGWVVGSSQGVRLASGRGWEGLPKASADTPPIILNSLHTDFFFFKLQSINKNETKTPDLKTIHGIRYKSRTADKGTLY